MKGVFTIMANEMVEKRNALLAKTVVANLEKRHFEAYYCPTTAEALQKALELIPEGSSVGWGGSVTIRDIAKAINESGVELERRFVALDKPIKYLGVYPVKLSLHPEVSQTVLVNIARSADEAKKQEKAYSNETAPAAEEAAAN